MEDIWLVNVGLIVQEDVVGDKMGIKYTQVKVAKL